MTNSVGDALNHNLQVGTAIRAGQLNDQIADRDLARQRATIDRLRSTTPSNAGNSQFALMEALGALHKKKTELAESENLVTEWMHSNDGMRALVKKYSERLGISWDQVRKEFAEAVVDLAETDPKYAHTKFGAKKRAQIGR